MSEMMSALGGNGDDWFGLLKNVAVWSTEPAAEVLRLNVAGEQAR